MPDRTLPKRGTAFVLALLALGSAPAPTLGQVSDDPATAREAEHACPAGTIQHIFIDNHSIFDTSDPDLDDNFRWAYSLANRLHVRTKEEVIRRELLFETGDCLDPVRLEESERLLRGYQFIARADIYAIQQPGGGQHVIVDTEDEWSTQLEARADLSGGFELEGLDLREQNLLGTGSEVGVFYRSMEATESYGVRYSTPQLFQTRWDAAVEFGRTRAGTMVHQEVSYPFLGEIGKWGFRQMLYRHDRLFDYIVPEDFFEDDIERRVLVPLREKGLHVAGLRRFGELGNLTVLGAGVSFLELSYPGDSTAIELVEDGLYEERGPAPPELRGPAAANMGTFRNIRAVLLVGKRNIVWRERRGLDSFRGEEDVRLGAEVELAFARSIPGLETDNDLYGSLDVYAAAGPPSAFLATRLRADARRDYDADPTDYEMKDVFGEGEFFVYLRPGFLPRHTLVMRAAGAAGWHVDTPYQITLGGEVALRGYPEEALPGGRRVVFSAEDRWYIGWPFPDVADIGTSLFADVGRIWPGEAPFGTDSGWRTSVGAGIRANFPAGGSNTFRIDIAFPMEGGSLGRPQLLIGVGEYLGITAGFSDPQFERSRMPPLTGNLLHFPN